MSHYDDNDDGTRVPDEEQERIAPIVPLRQRPHGSQAGRRRGEDPDEEAELNRRASPHDPGFWSVFDLPDDPGLVLSRPERPVAPPAATSPTVGQAPSSAGEPACDHAPADRLSGASVRRRAPRLAALCLIGLVLVSAAVLTVLATRMPSPGSAERPHAASGTIGAGDGLGGTVPPRPPATGAIRKLERDSRAARSAAPLARARPSLTVTTHPTGGSNASSNRPAVDAQGDALSSPPASASCTGGVPGSARSCAEAEFGFER